MRASEARHTIEKRDREVFNDNELCPEMVTRHQVGRPWAEGGGNGWCGSATHPAQLLGRECYEATRT